MSVWGDAINYTSKKELKGAEDHTIRNRFVFYEMQRRGMFNFDVDGGTECVWQVELFESTPEGHAEGQSVDYSRLNRYRQLTQRWASYVVTDFMPMLEKVQNKGDEALILRYGTILPKLIKDFKKKFGQTEIWIDGDATNNQNRLHGIESFFAVNTPDPGDLIATPNDTYAGQSTTLADQGGEWSTDLASGDRPNSTLANDWPDGKGDPQYDYLAPKAVNVSSTAWGTNETTFEDNCVRAIRRASDWSGNTNGVDGAPQAVGLSSNYYTAFKNKNEGKFRISVSHDKGNDLGFAGQTLQFEDQEIFRDFGIPGSTGYGINFDEVEFDVLTAKLFNSVGPDWDPDSYGWKFSANHFGNMRWNPKAHFKLAEYA